MAKYRKKPIIVDADVYKAGMEDGYDYRFIEFGEYQLTPFINTLEGKHYISKGDYIITGVKGERYPIKEDIFFETYDKVEDKQCEK